MMKSLEMSKEEANVLIQLLDVAVKAQGLQTAPSALHFVNKVQALFKEEEKAIEPVKED